ncbi:MAG: MATE family efflux transporter [Rhodothermales bacterium]
MHSSTDNAHAAYSSSLWRDISAAMRGAQFDYTSGNLWRAIIILAIPMVLEMVMQSVLEVVDIYFVGRLGADAVAAVGLTASLIIIIFAIGLGLGIAATAMVARRIGEKDVDGAGATVWQAVLLTLAVALPTGVFAIFTADDLLRLMGATESVVAIGTPYAQVMLGSNVVILMLFLLNAVFRGAGDASVAMRVLWIANILNIILDPILIFGWGPIPAYGVMGAAVATAIGRAAGIGYQVWILMGGRTRLQLRRKHMVLQTSVMRRLVRISLPGMAQYLVGTASWLALMRIMAEFGSEALAGYTVAVRIIIFALLPSWGIANAASTLVGQNLGAKQPDRAATSVWYCTLADVVFLSLMGVGFWIFADEVVGIFVSEAGARAVGVQSIHILTLAYPIWAVSMVIIQAFNGAGDTSTPTWIHFLAFWVLQLPAAWYLALHQEMGPLGVFLAIVAGQSAAAVMGAVMFRRGSWKATEV